MEQLIQTFKLLSDETRLRLLVILYYEKCCVCQLCGIMKESQPKISKHLAKLRDLGFIQDERQGQFIFYQLKHNYILFTIIETILEKIEDYPILKMDVEQIKNKESFLQSYCER